MAEKSPGYVVVEGPIGVGKTTLARRLAQSFGTDLVLESAEENPFLKRFYENPRGNSLPTQLFFLFQRVQQVLAMRQTDMFKPVQVSDFLLEKDRLFAELTLNEDELRLYEQVARHLQVQPPAPDLVIYLQAPVDVLMRRIAQRGIPYEQGIQAEYLERLVDAYVNFFYRYHAAPLLIVNTTDIDLANGAHDYDVLLSHLHQLPAGRHYFNPSELR